MVKLSILTVTTLVVLTCGCGPSVDPVAAESPSPSTSPLATPSPTPAVTYAITTGASPSATPRKQKRATWTTAAIFSSPETRTDYSPEVDLGHEKADPCLVEGVLKAKFCTSETQGSKLFVAGIQKMLEQAEYDRLEKLAAGYRKNREVLHNGAYRSTIMYYALKTPRQDELASALPLRLALWMESRPKSHVPRVAMARVLLEASEGRWKAAQGTLPPPYDEYFSDPLTHARTFLLEAAELSSDDVDVYALLIDYSRRDKVEPEIVEGYLKKGRAIDPDNYHLDAQYARYLDERGQDWRKALSRPENALYVLESYLQDEPVSAQEKLEFYQTTARKYPQSSYINNLIAREAVECENWEVASRAFGEVGDQYELYVWPAHEFFYARSKTETATNQKLPLNPLQLASMPAEFRNQELDELLFTLSTNELLKRQRFSELEQILSAVRQNRSHFVSNTSKTSAFYNAVDERDLGGYENTERMLKQLSLWRKKYPASTTAGTAYIGALITKAWDIRGGGYADSVSDSQWEGFRAHLNEAKSIYNELESKSEKDPELYTNRITTAMGLDEESETLFQFLEKAQKLDRLDPGPYQAVKLALEPRWGGTPSEREQFLQQVPLELYMFLGEGDDLDKIGESAMALAKKYPTVQNWSLALTISKETGNKERARTCLKQLNGRWSGQVFLSEQDVENIKKWAG